jgi:hypothetical protein
MKNLYYLTIIFPIIVNAQIINLENCVTIAPSHGHHKNPENLPSGCKNSIKNASLSLQQIVTSDEVYEVYGHKNIIYVDEYKFIDGIKSLAQSNALAGDQTKLTEIMSIDIDESTQRLFVLNKNLIDTSFANYKLDFIGNVVPQNYFSSANLNGVTNFRIDANKNHVYFLDHISGSILVHHLYADNNSVSPHTSSLLIKNIQGPNTLIIAPIDLAISESELYLLDGDRILVFNKNSSGDTAPIRLISGQNTQIASAKAINLSNDGLYLYITNGDNQILKFNRTSDGNILPE